MLQFDVHTLHTKIKSLPLMQMLILNMIGYPKLKLSTEVHENFT